MAVLLLVKDLIRISRGKCQVGYVFQKVLDILQICTVRPWFDDILGGGVQRLLNAVGVLGHIVQYCIFSISQFD